MRKCLSRYNGFFLSIVLFSLFVGNGCGTLLKHRVEPTSRGLDTEAWHRNPPLASIWNPRFSRVVIEVDYTLDARPYETTIKTIREIIEKYCVHIREVEIIFSDSISVDDLQRYVTKRRIYENEGGVTLSVPDDADADASVASFGNGFVFKETNEEIDIQRLARKFQNVPLSDETYLIYVWSDNFSESGRGGEQFPLSLTGGNKAGITLERKVLEKAPIVSTRTAERITALHELGHLLGLVENPRHHWSHSHCTNPACVMYPGKIDFRIVLTNWWAGLLGWTGLVSPKSKFCSECRADLCLCQQKVAEASRMIGNKSAVGSLIEALKDKDSNVRFSAAWALGMMGDKSAVKPLIKALKDEDPQVRASAARALSKIKDKSAIKPLIEALKDKEKRVSFYAACALAEIKDKSTVKLLIKLLKDKDGNIRSSAVMALGLIGDKSAVEPLLIAAFEDEDPDVRFNAAQALGKIDDKSVVKPLIEALKNEYRHVRCKAAEVLREITGQDFGQDYDKWLEWWEANK